MKSFFRMLLGLKWTVTLADGLFLAILLGFLYAPFYHLLAKSADAQDKNPAVVQLQAKPLTPEQSGRFRLVNTRLQEAEAQAQRWQAEQRALIGDLFIELGLSATDYER